MTIITISRGSYSMGKAVAEQLAERLGYECVSRDVLLEASGRFNIPEIKLEKAITDAPSILDRFTQGKQNYIAYIQSALAERVRQDKVVYHGLAGHILLRSVSHVLKVRINADLGLRASVLMERETIGRQEAEAAIDRLDSERDRWSKTLYGVGPCDPTLYDLTLAIPRFSVEDAVAMICRATEMKQFSTTTESQHQMDDLALACKVKVALVEQYPAIKVASTYGNVLIYCDVGDRQARKMQESAQQLQKSVEGINNIEIHAGVPPPANSV